MYLLVNSVVKYWHVNYRFAEKRKTLAFGVYPAVSLVKARQRRDRAREQLADGIDPSTAKKEEKQAGAMAAANTFELAAREFLQAKADSWSPTYSEKWMRGMAKDLFPYLGSPSLASIKAPALLDALKRVKKRGAIDTAHTFAADRRAGVPIRYSDRARQSST